MTVVYMYLPVPVNCVTILPFTIYLLSSGGCVYLCIVSRSNWYSSVLCYVFSSHLVTVATGPRLSDALISSPIIVEDGGAVPGAGFEFGVDPNEDPELALVSITHSLSHHLTHTRAPTYFSGKSRFCLLLYLRPHGVVAGGIMFYCRSFFFFATGSPRWLCQQGTFRL